VPAVSSMSISTYDIDNSWKITVRAPPDRRQNRLKSGVNFCPVFAVDSETLFELSAAAQMHSLDGTQVVDGVLQIDLPTGPHSAKRAGSDDALAPELGTFVAGPENRLPILALEKLLAGEAEFSTAAWANPLMLVGPAGSGKSLLVRAVVRRWLPVLGPDRVSYFTAIDFARQLLAARTDGMLAELRASLARLQLLVIEDLHKLPAKLALHHELRDLFDKLSESGAIVICTSQLSPTVQPQLEAGLADRLSGGLVLWLNHPSTEARLELLCLVTRQRGTQIDDRHLRTLAESVTGPVPHLFRALREWELAAKLGRHPATARTGISAKDVIAVVARYFGVTQSALRGPGRRKSLVFARNTAVYLLRTLSDASYAQIGKDLGHRDHSTIMHSMESMQLALATDAATQHSIEELRRILLAV
jgi:chromosomal replication initiator protein